MQTYLGINVKSLKNRVKSLISNFFFGNSKLLPSEVRFPWVASHGSLPTGRFPQGFAEQVNYSSCVVVTLLGF